MINATKTTYHPLARNLIFTTDANSYLSHFQLSNGCQFQKYSDNLGQFLSLCRHFLASGHNKEDCNDQEGRKGETRLMTMSPLYPCGKPCSRGTHHETVKNLALFSSIINGIRKASRLRISVPWECFQFFINRIENSITFTR